MAGESLPPSKPLTGPAPALSLRAENDVPFPDWSRKSHWDAIRSGWNVNSYYESHTSQEVICVATDAVCQRVYCRRRHVTHVYVRKSPVTA